MSVPPVTAWPAPAALYRPTRDRLKRIVDERGAFVGVVLPVVLLYLALPALVPLLLAAAVVVGALLAHARWTVQDGWWAGWKCAAYAAVGGGCGIGLDRIDQPRPAALLLLAVLQLLLGRPEPEAKPGPLDSRVLAPALVRAGVLKPLPGGVAPKVLYRSGFLDVEHGVKRKIDLCTATHTALTARRAELALQLKVPERAVVVEHDPNDSPSVVTLWVGQVKTSGPTRSPLGDVLQTSWRDPVRVGTDAQGRPVELDLFEQNVIVGGRMGYGKTVTARLLLAHLLLDPTAVLYGLDGKGSRKDYAPLVSLARRWVWGTDPDPVPAVLAMLREMLAIVQERNSSPDEPDGGWPCLALLLEEYQDVRAAATAEQRDELDSLLGRIVRMHRAVGGLLIVSTQRPTVDDLPSGVRNLLSIGICLNVRPDDARILLGTTPDLPIPSRKGEAIVGTPKGQQLVDVDLLDLPEWKAVCARAAELRPTPVDLTKPVVVADRQPDPFGDRVRALLASGPKTATAIWEALPVLVRPATMTALGRALGKLEGVEQQRGAQRLWVLNPSSDPSTVPAEPVVDGSERPFHAQTAAQGRNPSNLTSAP